jgi:uncharacterized protein YdeI (BOF family)
MVSIKTTILGGTLFLASSASGFVIAGDTLTSVDALQRGMPATVQGTVVRITDEDTFRLQDGTGDVSVYIGWQNRVTVKPGDVVTVEGVVDDDLMSFVWPELYAQRITREDGSVIELR